MKRVEYIIALVGATLVKRVVVSGTFPYLQATISNRDSVKPAVMKDYAADTQLTPLKMEVCLDLCLELDDPEIFLAICLEIARLLLMRCVRSGTAQSHANRYGSMNFLAINSRFCKFQVFSSSDICYRALRHGLTNLLSN
jgi:hypothetical protein